MRQELLNEEKTMDKVGNILVVKLVSIMKKV